MEPFQLILPYVEIAIAVIDLGYSYSSALATSQNLIGGDNFDFQGLGDSKER